MKFESLSDFEDEHIDGEQVDDDMLCRNCNGTGEGSTADTSCSSCHGMGTQPTHELEQTTKETEECPECFGTGLDPMSHDIDEDPTCTACDGTGGVEVYDAGGNPLVAHTNESTDFDKFMDSTLIMEQKKKTVDASKTSPQRLLARGYQEHPLGKIRIGGPRRV